MSALLVRFFLYFHHVQMTDMNLTRSRRTISDGTYTDTVSGNKFTIKKGKLTGTIGEQTAALIYNKDKATVSARAIVFAASLAAVVICVVIILITWNSKKKHKS